MTYAGMGNTRFRYLASFSFYALYDTHGLFLQISESKPLHILLRFICNYEEGDGMIQ